MTDTLKLDVVSDEEAFDALADAWRALHDAHGRSVFQSYEWNRAWWRAFGGEKKAALSVIVVRDGSTVMGIAPFFYERQRVLGVIPLRTLRWLGAGMNDYQDVLVAPDKAPGFFSALAAHMTSANAADILVLNDLPADAAAAALLHALRGAGFAVEPGPSVPCPRLVLAPTWEATLASMKPSHAKRIAYIDRKLKRNFDVAVETASRESLEADFDLFVEMHQARWLADGQPGVMASPRMRAFHRDVARAFAARGWLALSFLSLNGKRVAANYAFKRNGVVEFYLSGAVNDDASRKFAPGILLHVYCIQALIAEGGTVYDFLRGDERYKYELGAFDRHNRSSTLLNPRRPQARALLATLKAQSAAHRLAVRVRRELDARLGALAAIALLENPLVLSL